MVLWHVDANVLEGYRGVLRDLRLLILLISQLIRVQAERILRLEDTHLLLHLG